MGRCVAATITLVGVAITLSFSPATAQIGSAPFFEGLRIEEPAGALELHIGFTHPVRYVRHAPHGPASTVDVQLAPAGTWPFAAGKTEALQPPRGSSPIQSVRVEVAHGDARLEVNFSGRTEFEVAPGRDLRSIVIRLPSAPRSPAEPVGDLPSPDPRATKMMEEGRRAFTKGEFARAALIFGEVTRMPESRLSPEARELLGVARERTGQLAHAKAEYEEYLRRYPTHEGADRVRQRLAAIATTHALPKTPLRPRDEEGPRIDIDTFGSLYAGFRREELFFDGGNLLVDNSLLTDVHFDARVRRRGKTLRTQLSASYWQGFFDSGSDGQARIYSAFLESGKPGEGLAWSFGRRTASSRGVIGRYDGAQLSYAVGDRWEIGAIAGLPVYSSRVDDFDASRYLAGANAAVRGLAEVVDVNLFMIGQMDGDILDRAAIGGELRYFENGRLIAAFVDFDLYFQSLNVAQLITNWQIDPRVFLSATLDYRNVPILTTANALIGQPTGSLDSLVNSLSQSEVKQLAEDRTARAGTLTLNGSYALTPSLQLAGDFIISYLSGTSTSGGVQGTSSTGVNFSYALRLIANELLSAGDVNVFSLRYFDGEGADVLAATFDARYPLARSFRLNPRLIADYRMAELGSDLVRVIPSLRCDWDVFGLRLEPEVGFEWLEPLGQVASRQLGYFAMFGVRYDF